MKIFKRAGLVVHILGLILVFYYLSSLEPLERASVLDRWTHIFRKKVEIRVSENVSEEGVVENEVPEDYFNDHLKDVYREFKSDRGIIKTGIIKDNSPEGDSMGYKRELIIYNKRPIMDIFTRKKYTRIDMNRVTISLELLKENINGRSSDFIYSGEIREYKIIRAFYSIDEDKFIWGEMWDSWEDRENMSIEDMRITFKGFNCDNRAEIGKSGRDRKNPVGYKKNFMADNWTKMEFRAYSNEGDGKSKDNNKIWEAFFLVEIETSFGTIEDIYADFDFTMRY